MYTPPHFKVESRDELFKFMQSHPFGTLVSTNGNLEPKATHLPFLVKQEESGELLVQGHIANANDHSEILKTGRSALAIFAGPHAYVTSSVYEKPDAPTWNYQAVHTYGTVRKLTSKELYVHLDELMSTHEHVQHNPSRMSDIPESQRNTYLELITGFELKVYKIEATYKLSQNRSDKDFLSVVAQLEKDPSNKKLVQEMGRRRKK
jgi:transcriptional regulator